VAGIFADAGRPSMVTARRAEATDVCRLCRQPSVLQNSHVIPEWGYGRLYDDKHRMIALRSGGRQPASADYMQKGIRERLLCKRCETRLSRYEKYARDLLMTRGLVLPPPRRQVVNQADYTPFKLFQLSLLWRAHLSRHLLFAAVDLGATHAERLRTMLDSEDPGDAADYPCFLSVLYVAGEQRADVMLPAGHGRTEGQRTYRLIFAGFHWMFVVSSHTRSHRMASTLALQPDGRFHLHGFEGIDSEGLRAYARSLMLPNRQNIERLQAGSTRRR
jgi:hypothetical protein